MTYYSAAHIADYFDEYGEKEWQRLVQTPTEEVKLYVHAHYLRQHVCRGDNVLEVGAGAGRFTQILVELGTNVVVADISEGQLNLNRQHAAELGFEHGVRDRMLLDVCDMSVLPDSCFDVVVGYGGPLSYVFEHRGTALNEILRVLKPGGVALLSVMSLWGTIHEFLPGVLPIDQAVNDRILSSGDLSPETLPSSKHYCHMFRATEFRGFLLAAGARIIAISASNCLSAAWKDQLNAIREDPIYYV